MATRQTRSGITVDEVHAELDSILAKHVRKTIPSGVGITASELAERKGRNRQWAKEVLRKCVAAGDMVHIGYRGQARVYDVAKKR